MYHIIAHFNFQFSCHSGATASQVWKFMLPPLYLLIEMQKTVSLGYLITPFSL